MISFQNEGLLDLHAITTFGASVKEGSSPIGQFGTGLKYAIAVLLRLEQLVTIQVGGVAYSFHTEKTEIRGKSFDMVWMESNTGDSIKCGFTTELGKHWDLWMAYRELVCNCMDEGGTTTKVDYPADAGESQTIVTVSGAAFDEVYANRHQYILEGTPHLTFDDLVDVRVGVASTHLYYRNINVGRFNLPMLHTYNVRQSIELTEDRTAKYPWVLDSIVRNVCMHSTDEDFIRSIIMAPTGTFEGQIGFNTTAAPGDTFKKVVKACFDKNPVTTNNSAYMMCRSHDKVAFAPKPYKLSVVQNKSLERAIAFVKGMGCDIDKYPIYICEDLGESTLALALHECIWIGARVFELGGAKMLASTLFEEYLHLAKGFRDESRGMQQYLFDRIISMQEEANGEPL